MVKKIWTDDVSNSKCTQNSDFFGMPGTLLDLRWIVIVLNLIILFIPIPICNELGVIDEDDFSMKICVIIFPSNYR